VCRYNKAAFLPLAIEKGPRKLGEIPPAQDRRV
jgi:hypothetical protein